MTFAWTEDREADLTRWRDGQSAGTIAAAYRVTRNTVLGKISRLGLHRASASDIRRAADQAAEKRRRERDRKRQERATAVKQAEAPPIRAPLPMPAFACAAPSEGVTLTELGSCQCRWPLNTWAPGEGVAARFCGEPTSGPDYPYCSLHAGIAHAGGSSARDLTRSLRRVL